MRTHERVVIAHHLVITLYGHWLPNDLRGSGSTEFYDDKFAALGPIHRGRKPQHLQPSRSELHEFHAQVKPLLNFEPLWIDDATRQIFADAIGEVIHRNRYTCYRCAICANHLHLVIRKHRDSYEEMWRLITEHARAQLVASHHSERIAAQHPVFSQRPYAVFLYTIDDIYSRVQYVSDNPQKEGLPEQHFDFETLYDGWPHTQRQM
jgi:REP element-mobilizing transposase RayT